MLHGIEATMRKLLASLALGISLCALSAGPAAAERPEKAPIYGPELVFSHPQDCEEGPVPTPETFGFLRLDTPRSPTTLRGEAELRHARPNTTYEVQAVQAIADICPSLIIGEITTNKRGSGRLGFTIEREQHNPVDVLRVVLFSQAADAGVFGSAPVALR
jgi:hypothetical protein